MRFLFDPLQLGSLFYNHIAFILFGTPQWPIYCDEKSWDSPWVIAADIQATLTLLLLDQNLKKEYEAENVAQMDLWLLRKNFP